MSVKRPHEGHLEVINEVRLIEGKNRTSLSRWKISRTGDLREICVDGDRKLPARVGGKGFSVRLRERRHWGQNTAREDHTDATRSHLSPLT